MKLTKYEHACFTVEKDGKLLVVDPGNWTTDFAVPDNISAVVVTHEHPDHFYPPQLTAIIEKNPEVIVVAHSDVLMHVPGLPARSVGVGDVVNIGSFTLEFFGGEHATIYPDFGHFANLGVLIDDAIYYPGDSFALPQKSVSVLLLPVTAPWLKIQEVIDFMVAVAPNMVVPAHDAIASDKGKALVDRLVGGVAEQKGIRYERLRESLEV